MSFIAVSEPAMQIRDYQNWLHEWDSARNWDRMLPSHTLLHAMEEMGEVARLVQVIEGYREPGDATREEVRTLLALELSDLQVMLFKVAYLCGIDMEDAMARGMAKADARFPDPAPGREELDAYWQRFRAYLTEADLARYLSPSSDPSSPRAGDQSSGDQSAEDQGADN